MPREAMLGGAPLRESEFMSGIDVQARDVQAKIEKVARAKDPRDKGKTLAILFVKVGGESRKIKINAAIEGALCSAFGKDARAWAGHDVVLYYDASIQFGGRRVGGLRVRTGAPSKAEPQVDADKSAVKRAELLAGISVASTADELTAMSEAIKAARGELTVGDTEALRDAYRARQDALTGDSCN